MAHNTVDSKKISMLYEQTIQPPIVLNEGIVTDLLWFAAKVVDPTGVLSWGDFKAACTEADWSTKAKGAWSALKIVLTFYMCIPNLGLIVGGAAGATAGAVGGTAVTPVAGTAVGGGAGAVTGAVAGGTAWTFMKIMAKILTNPKVAAAASKKPWFDKAINYVTKKAADLSRNGIVGKLIKETGEAAEKTGRITTKELDDFNKALEKIGGVKIKWQKRTRAVYGAIAGAAAGSKKMSQEFANKYGPGGAPIGPGGSNTTDQSITINLPDGRQIQTTRAAAQQAGMLPMDQPQPQSYNFNGNVLTPAQAAALGPFAVPKTATAPGQLIPQNIPQGATQRQPFGREGMAPQQYMRPDNFNNPPTSFLGPRFFNQPNYYGQPVNQQYGGVAGGVADMGNILGGLLQNIGGLAGQLAGTPVMGIGNMAGGLLNILPGLGGGGIFPGMGGV